MYVPFRRSRSFCSYRDSFVCLGLLPNRSTLRKRDLRADIDKGFPGNSLPLSSQAYLSIVIPLRTLRQNGPRCAQKEPNVPIDKES